MKTIACTLAALVLAIPFAARAQVDVQIDLRLPTIRFETAPVLVEVEPGVQIVEGYDDELFFHSGWYWHRRDGVWFRARDWRRPAWARAEPRVVPEVILRVPPGHYRRWRREDHREWKEIRREEKREEKEDKREDKERRREKKREHHGKHGR